jgi:hypothetical protein
MSTKEALTSPDNILKLHPKTANLIEHSTDPNVNYSYDRRIGPDRRASWPNPTSQISLSGLGARYVSQDIWPYDVNTLSIVANENRKIIRGIAYKVISDRKMFSKPSNEDVRKVGIRFVNLTKNQRGQLVAFIQRFGIQPMLNNQRI